MKRDLEETVVRDQTSSSANNSIHLSDESGESDSSTRTPTIMLPLSNSQPSMGSEANKVNLPATNTVPQPLVQDIDMTDVLPNPFFNLSRQAFQFDDISPDEDFNSDTGFPPIPPNEVDPPPNPLAL